MSEKQIELSQPFKERIFERIKKDIGELLTDDELKQLVQTAVHKAFFEPVVKLNSYGSVMHTEPPEFVTEIKKLVDAQVRAQVAQHIKDNPDLFTEIFKEVLAKGFVGIVKEYFESRMFESLQNLRNDFNQAVNRY